MAKNKLPQKTLKERLTEHIEYCRQCEISRECKGQRHPFFMSAEEAKKLSNLLNN